MSALPLASVIGPVIRVVPVIIIVILSAPAWLTWPFLPEAKQKIVLQMVDALARWTRGDCSAMEHPDSDTPLMINGHPRDANPLA